MHQEFRDSFVPVTGEDCEGIFVLVNGIKVLSAIDGGTGRGASANKNICIPV